MPRNFMERLLDRITTNGGDPRNILGGAASALSSASSAAKKSSYTRVPSHGTISASTTSASLYADFDQHHHHQPQPRTASFGGVAAAALKESSTTESEDEEEDEPEDFERARLHFQKQRQISVGSARKFKMEMGDVREMNLKNHVPFVKRLSGDSTKDYSINNDPTTMMSSSGSSSPLPYKPTTTKINYATQFLVAISVSLGSFVVGFTTGYSSPALESMYNDNSTIVVTRENGSWIAGMMPLAALAGAVLGGFMIVRLGRRNTILAIAPPFVASNLLIAAAADVGWVYAGRALAGLCVGVGTLAFPVYLGEVLRPEVRGRLGLLPTALGNVGILVCYASGMFLEWSPLAYLGAVLPLPYLVLLSLVPETPRWHVTRGNHKSARAALEWLRGGGDGAEEIDSELRDIVKSHEDAERDSSSIFDLFNADNRRIVCTLLFLMFCQQFSGINAVMFYSVSIFESAGGGVDKNVSSIIIGVVNFAATFLATALIDRLGRKALLYVSSAAMILTLATLGGYFYAQSADADVSAYGLVPLASLVVYVLGFSIGFGPIPWLMMGEVLPARVRGSAASFATAFNWLCTFFVTKYFDAAVELLGKHGTFWLFGAVCVVGLVFTCVYVPETRGKSLEDIERQVRGGGGKK